jgi:hypothetical protein
MLTGSKYLIKHSLKLLREISAFFSENRGNPMNSRSGQNAEFRNSSLW